jgi:hypothetical protein
MTSLKQKTEMGTSNPNDVDYDWLPQETLNTFSNIFLMIISHYC